MLIFFLATSLNLFFICQRTSVTVFHVLSKIYTNAQFCFAWHPCTRIFRETYCLQIQCKIAKNTTRIKVFYATVTKKTLRIFKGPHSIFWETLRRQNLKKARKQQICPYDVTRVTCDEKLFIY